VCIIIIIIIIIIINNINTGQTDGLTYDDSIYYASIVLHSNIIIWLIFWH